MHQRSANSIQVVMLSGAMFLALACGLNNQRSATSGAEPMNINGDNCNAVDTVALSVVTQDANAGLQLVSRAISGYRATFIGGLNCWGNQANPYQGDKTHTLRVRKNAVGCGLSITDLRLMAAAEMIATADPGLSTIDAVPRNFQSADGTIQLFTKIESSFRTDRDSEVVLLSQENSSATAATSVTKITLASITVTPPTATIDPNETQQYKAIGHYSDNRTLDLTNQVVWSIGTGTIAQKTSTPGLFKGLMPGTTSITASFEGLSGTASLQVNDWLLTITYHLVQYANEAAPRCLWIADANDATAAPAFLGCNTAATWGWGIAANHTIKMSFKGPSAKIRLIFNAAVNTAEPDPQWITWRNTSNLSAMALHMNFHRTNHADSTSTIEGKIDDSSDMGCNPGDPWNFADIWFKLDVSSLNYSLENIASSCAYVP